MTTPKDLIEGQLPSYFLEQYPVLVNYVSVDNELSIKWLKYLGAKFYDPSPYGKEGKMFMRFEFRREDA